MPHRPFILAGLLVLMAVPAAAQHAPGQHHPGANAQPYAGLEQRQFSALAPEQIADLRAGRGMALALAAELNRYPGPMHALDHAAEIGLSDVQAARLRSLMTTMRRDAIDAGERVIAAEQALDAVFSQGLATSESVAAAAAQAGAAWAALRAVHLVTHIATRDALTPEQVARYDVLRGYRGGG